MKKYLTNIITVILIITMLISLFPINVQAVTQTKDSKINNIDDKKYPGIKTMIQNLQKKHPKWNFKVLYTGLDWNKVIKEESVHGRNTIYKSYSSPWRCQECGNKAYSGSGWLCASSAAISYMMDPRNSLYYEDVFQFLELSYDSNAKYDTNIMKSILKGSFLDDGKLDTYINTIVARCKTKNVNPYYIAGKIIQEQGKKGGSTWKMKTTVDGKTVYYYNIFNINASGSTTSAIINNALTWSKAKGWDTIEKCLNGGVDFIANGYITAGQDTLYFEKFDVIQSSLYWHQYAQDVMYAQNQGEKIRKMLENLDATEYAYTFVIPLYENMPSKACPRPTATSSNTTTNNNTTNNNTTNSSTTASNDSNTTNSTGNSGVANKQKTGDITGDSNIDSADLLYLRKYLLGKIKFTNEQKKSADTNSDGVIDSADLLNVRKYLLGKIKNF